MPIEIRVLGDPERLAHVLRIAGELPEAEVSGDRHLAFRIRKKTFAYYQDDHHGDGIVCLSCKSTFEIQRDSVGRHPERYFVPPYVGAQGWVALRLDKPEIDWGEVAGLLLAAYKLQAPRRLADSIG